MDETQAPLGLTRPRMQALVLVALGIVSAILSLVVLPLPGIGLLALGLGLLLAHLVYRRRLFIAGVMVTAFAITYLLNVVGVISGGELYGAYILAAAVSVGIVVIAARQGYVGHDPFTPALLLALIGALAIGAALPGGAVFYPTDVSLVMSAMTLAGLGIIYFVASAR